MSAALIVFATSLPALLLPHLLPLHRATPVTGALVWMLDLLLRAGVMVGAATFAFVQLAHAEPVEAVLAWCWHEVLPDIPAWLGLAEHRVAHAAVLLPAVAVALVVMIESLTLVRGWIHQRRQLPADVAQGAVTTSVIADEHVVVAVTRIGRGRVLVSDRALEVMDADELAAGLAHEAAHIRRRHRPVLLAASLLAAIARPLPGTRTAERELCFQLERDADADAVRRLQDPLSLASAICKAAEADPPGIAASLAGRGPVTRRVAELLGESGAPSRRVEISARVLASAFAALLLALAIAAPASAVRAAAGDSPRAGHDCSHH
jgi:Zn-dependent protease with chaperone function